MNIILFEIKNLRCVGVVNFESLNRPAFSSHSDKNNITAGLFYLTINAINEANLMLFFAVLFLGFNLLTFCFSSHWIYVIISSIYYYSNTWTLDAPRTSLIGFI